MVSALSKAPWMGREQEILKMVFSPKGRHTWRHSPVQVSHNLEQDPTSSAIENLFLSLLCTVIPTFTAQTVLLQVSWFRGWPHNAIQIFKESSPTEQGAGKPQNGLETLFCPLTLKAIVLTPFLI